MEEQVQGSKPLKGFAIAGIIIGCLALLLSLFSFAGAMFSWAAASAIWPGIIALVLGILGLIFASKAKAKKGLAIAVIVVSVIAVGLGYWGVQKSASAFEDVTGDLDDWADEMNDALEELE
jgi:multidrug transporter EmrE-like cation transporter